MINKDYKLLLDEYSKSVESSQLETKKLIDTFENIKSKHDALIEITDNCTDETEIAKLHSELSAIHDELCQLRDKSIIHLDANIKIGEFAQKTADVYSNELNKMANNVDNNYKYKLKYMNNLLAACFGALLLINISFPNISSNYLVTFGAIFVTIFSTIIYKKRTNSIRNRTLNELTLLMKDIEEASKANQAIISELSDLKNHFCALRDGGKHD